MTNTSGTEAASGPVTYGNGPPTSIASPVEKPGFHSPDLSSGQQLNDLVVSAMNPFHPDPSPPPSNLAGIEPSLSISCSPNEISKQINNKTPASNTSSRSSHRRSSDHVKRPMNAFLIWSTRRRHEIKEKEPQITMAEISKLLGNEWKDMTLEQRQPFIDQAKQIRAEHMTKYPDYKYQPRRKKNTQAGMPGKVKCVGAAQNNVNQTSPLIAQSASATALSNGGIAASLPNEQVISTGGYPATVIYQNGQAMLRLPQSQVSHMPLTIPVNEPQQAEQQPQVRQPHLPQLNLLTQIHPQQPTPPQPQEQQTLQQQAQPSQQAQQEQSSQQQLQQQLLLQTHQAQQLVQQQAQLQAQQQAQLQAQQHAQLQAQQQAQLQAQQLAQREAQQQAQQQQKQAQQEQQQAQQQQLAAASVPNPPVVVASNTPGQGYVILQSGSGNLYLQPIPQLPGAPNGQPMLQPQILASPQAAALAQPPMQSSPQLQGALQNLPQPTTQVLTGGSLLVSGDTPQPMSLSEGGQVPFLQM